MKRSRFNDEQIIAIPRVHLTERASNTTSANV